MSPSRAETFLVSAVGFLLYFCIHRVKGATCTDPLNEIVPVCLTATNEGCSQFPGYVCVANPADTTGTTGLQCCPVSTTTTTTSATTTSSTTTTATTTTCADLLDVNGRSSCGSMVMYCTNPNYSTLMRQQCPLTCGYCNGGIGLQLSDAVATCTDQAQFGRPSDCTRLAAHCFDNAWRTLMAVQCPRTCGYCTC